MASVQVLENVITVVIEETSPVVVQVSAARGPAGVDGVAGAAGPQGPAGTAGGIDQLTGDVTAGPGTGSQATTIAKIQTKTVSGTTGTGNVVFSASPTLTGTLTAATVTASGAVIGSNLSGTNTGDQTITLTGDVTGTGTGSFATTIANDAVTFAKMQNIATDSLMGRDTASTGDPENILLNTTLSMDGSGNLQRAALTGDVTASAGSNATTVAKIQTTTVSGTTGSGNVVFSTSPTLVTPSLGTPSALVGTNITGTASGLTAGNVTTNANLTGPITSVGNATSVAAQTGTGTTFVMNASPTLVTPIIGVATATSVNKVTITAPATSSTLTVADGSTLATSGANSITLTSTGATNVTLPTTGTLSTLAGSEALTNKTIGNTNTVTLKDTLFTVQDDGDATKLLAFQLSGITTGTTRTLTVPDSSSTIAVTANNLSVFAATTSAQLAGVISDETGSGALVFANTPTLVTPVLGVATATSLNKVTVTAPATSSTLTIADGSTLATSGANSITLTSTGATNVTLPTTGTLATLAGAEELTNKTLTSSVGKGTWTASGTWTLPAHTLGGVVLFSENTELSFPAAALTADGKYCGITDSTYLAGAALAFGEIVYFDSATSRWKLAKADADATSGAVRIGVCVLAAAGNGSATNILTYGKIRADAKFPTFTVGAPVYISAATAGLLTVTQPSSTDQVIRIMGYGNTGDELFFCPSNDYMTHT